MLSKKFKNKNIYLASSSPRRQELFKHLDVKYSIKTKNVDEKYPPHLKAVEITNYLAKLKANAFSNELTGDDIVITADTIVWYEGEALEKPKNESEAVSMLKRLSGKVHEVISSVCIKTSSSQKIFHDITVVHFKQFSQEEIDFYVKNYKPLDKAGAYGIQEWIGIIGVVRLEGSYFNVMGLPVHKLYEELLKI